MRPTSCGMVAAFALCFAGCSSGSTAGSGSGSSTGTTASTSGATTSGTSSPSTTSGGSTTSGASNGSTTGARSSGSSSTSGSTSGSSGSGSSGSTGTSGSVQCPPPSGPVQIYSFAGAGNHVGMNGSSQFALLPSGTVAALLLPAKVGQVQLTYDSMTPVTGDYEISINPCPGDIISTDPSCYFESTNPANLALNWGDILGSINNTCFPATNDGTWYANIRYTYSDDCNGSPCGEQLQWNQMIPAPDAG